MSQKALGFRIVLSVLSLSAGTGCVHAPATNRATAGLNDVPPLQCAAKAHAIYKTVNLRPGYLQRDAQNGLDKFYFDDATREKHRFVVLSGRTYSNDCKPLSDPDGGGEVNYVMDASGNLYWFDEFKNPNTRHSAVFRGGPVAGAGNIRIAQGRIVAIDSDSGHYPTGPLFENVLKELQLDGVDLGHVNVTRTPNL